VVTHLLSNAVKFTSEGGITVRVTEGEPTRRGQRVRFEVADTRIGIEPGRGSTFWFTADLELPEPAAEPEPAAPEPAPAEVAILVVDDNAVNRMIAAEMLRKRGHRVEVAKDGDGAEAVAAAATERFAVTLMDCHMPIMDGYEAIERWRPANEKSDLDLGVLSRLTSDAGGAPDLVGLFREDSKRELAQVADALRDRDAQAVARAAHALKGSSGQLGATRTESIAAQLQAVAETGELGSAKALLRRLETAIDAAHSALSSALPEENGSK
jgi:CheY-like chemotaxis protein